MSHDDFQPPEHDEPEKDDDDRMYGALSDLAGLDTHDVNLRDHPKAYEVLDRLMTHAYAEGRSDQARESRMSEWQPIETAPRGSGEDGPHMVTDPGYVEPPKLLIASEEGIVVGYYDWYYHAGYGSGAEDGVPAWRMAVSHEPVYGATHWMLLPQPPEAAS